jgi:hypothetical protein
MLVVVAEQLVQIPVVVVQVEVGQEDLVLVHQELLVLLILVVAVVEQEMLQTTEQQQVVQAVRESL